MDFPQLTAGHFVKRNNRFRVTVLVGGEEVSAHLPNSGRLSDLLKPGQQVLLAPAHSPQRKTAYDLTLVRSNAVLVSVNAQLPNRLFAEALRDNTLPGFRFPLIEQEVTYGDSRLDFRLSGPSGICWVETKSVTLVNNDGVALFPDAPSTRASKHAHSLAKLCKQGHRTAVVFVIQRPDAQTLSPNGKMDPAFTAALRQAKTAGVEIWAFICHVSLDEIRMGRQIPVHFPRD